MQIINSKFEYGNKEIKFNQNHMAVDFVDKPSDLNYWEDKFKDHAVYLVNYKIGGSVNYKLFYKYALVTTEENLTDFYNPEKSKEEQVCQ